MKYNQLQNLVVWNPGKRWNFFRKALEMIIFAKKMDNDSIHHTIINNLADGQVEFLGTTGKETGTMSYSIAIMPEDVAVAEDIDIQSGKGLWWIGVALGLALGVFFIVRYILKKHRGNEVEVEPVEQDASLRYELLRHKDINKKFCQKGYFSTVRQMKLEALEEHEINELCDAVSGVFLTLVEFLNNHGLSAKDFKFCCLVKSRLSTSELSEIYDVSESAIFKRKLKIKEMLGDKSDNSNLAAILEDK